MKGIDDQLAAGGDVSRIPLASTGDFLKMLPGHLKIGKSAKQAHERTDWKLRKSLPEIVVNGRQLIEVIDEAWEAVHLANQPEPVIFSGYGALVRLAKKQVIKDWPEDFVIEIMNVAQVYGRLLRSAEWVSEAENADGNLIVKPSRPPKDCALDMLTFPSETLPRLESIFSSPRYNARGNLISTPGYHEEDGVFFDPRGELKMPKLPSTPSLEDVRRAKEIIFDEVFPNFPFVAQSDRVHAALKPLAVIGRRLIHGPTPLHLDEAAQHGTGKGLLGDVSSIITIGRPAQVSTLPTNESDVKKFITSLLIAGSEEVVLDNADDKKPLHSPNLAAVLTCVIWTDRVLGLSQNVSVPNLAIWSLTGNNIKMSGELARRCVRSRLDAKTDQPWLRPDSDFKHPRLKEWVQENRGEIIWAYLVLIENWKANGRPKSTKRLGSYEAYCEFIGGVLEAAGIEGFLNDLQDFYATVDVEGQVWREFTAGWWAKFKGADTTVGELNKMCDEEEFLEEARGIGLAQSKVTKLGLALKERAGRCFGNFTIEKGEPNGKKGRQYKITQKKPGDQAAASATSPKPPQEGPRENSGEKSEGYRDEGDLGDLIQPSSCSKKCVPSRGKSIDHAGHNGATTDNVLHVPADALTGRNSQEIPLGTSLNSKAPEGPLATSKMAKDQYESI